MKAPKDALGRRFLVANSLSMSIEAAEESSLERVEETNILGLQETARICRQDHDDNAAVPTGLQEVNLDV